jgi:uncharacterized protein involved in tolerance to divalent cations
MVNIYIYVDSRKNARDMVIKLMEKKLLAHASIDKDNESFIRKDGKILEEENYVITAQTKALLFNEVVGYVAHLAGDTVKIFSVPITQCNKSFEERIRENTKMPLTNGE